VEEVGQVVEKRHSTIIIIPHAQGKVYKLRLSPRTLKLLAASGIALVLLSLASLAASGSFLRERAMYRALERDNGTLRRSNQRLAETVAQVKSRLDQFEQRTKTLAIAAGVSDLLTATSDDAHSGVGSGGPLDRLSAEPEALVRRQEQLDKQLAKVEQKLHDQAVMLAHTPTIAPVVGVITDGYGPRIDPITHRPAFHEGLDISVAIGTPVRAPADGLVIFADRETGYGRVIKIDHGYGYATTYAHLDRLLVKEGAKITRGQVLGKVGLTGRTTGPHLHYEVWKDGERQNPLHFILDAF
jgi:murein DD-endopeptidase MepM/ murein hydrolase activator NlpD